jgi:hypothetical protein
MKALSIRFDEETYENLRQNSEKKALAIAEYARRLIEIGLRVEMAASKNTGKTSEDELKELWQKELSWTLETRFLTRFLVEKLLASDEKDNLQFMKEARIKAENYVLGMMGEHEDEDQSRTANGA